MENLETKTSETVLQKPIEVKVGDEVFLAAPPSFATLIELSRFIPDLAEVKGSTSEDIVMQCLAYAGKSEYIGEMVAIMILGAKGIRPEVVKKRKWLFIPREEVVYPQKVLGQKINLELSIKEIFELFVQLLNSLDVVFFSEITTFLRGVNLIKKTKS